uniref:Uncharacterized protein n=1 Tax=Meloidogyne javanica TaxID=6303 RepID=A0A915M4R0_MELJA
MIDLVLAFEHLEIVYCSLKTQIVDNGFFGYSPLWRGPHWRDHIGAGHFGARPLWRPDTLAPGHKNK